MDRESFGKRLNKVRKEQAMSSMALASLCEIDPVFIRQIEAAARLPSLPTFINICNALEVSPDYLLSDNITNGKKDTFDLICNDLRSLTPKQLEYVADAIHLFKNRFSE